MSGHRVERVAQDIQRLMPDILSRMKDPRLGKGLLSITRVEVSHDLSHASIYISSVEGLQAAKEAVAGLAHGAGFVRTEINRALQLRKSPELKFVADDSIEYGAKISEKLKHLDTGEHGKEQ